MTEPDDFKLEDFLPYILSQAAEALGSEFQNSYKTKYNMLRTEWRVLFHLGSFGDLTAKDICDRTNTEKTKVSRAVSALETKGYLSRHTLDDDRRQSVLRLTPLGAEVFDDLRGDATQFHSKVRSTMTAEEYQVLRKLLLQFAQLDRI